MALGKSRHTLSLTSLHSVTQMSGGGATEGNNMHALWHA